MLVLSLDAGEENDVSRMSYQDRVPKSLSIETPIHLTRGGFGALDLIADWYCSCDRCSLSYSTHGIFLPSEIARRSYDDASVMCFQDTSEAGVAARHFPRHLDFFQPGKSLHTNETGVPCRLKLPGVG
jgi:hypothetical protein